VSDEVHPVNHAHEVAQATPEGLRELAEDYAALKRAEAPATLLARLETLVIGSVALSLGVARDHVGMVARPVTGS
jgi:hypothetical protein